MLRVLKRTDPIPGKDITLTLDLELQEAAEAALAGRRGAIVALQPSTGEVLSAPELLHKGHSVKRPPRKEHHVNRRYNSNALLLPGHSQWHQPGA